MPAQFTAPTTYFLEEGKANLQDCLKVAFEAARNQNIGKLVIFTSEGEGVRLALTEFCSQDQYNHIKLVAVTFPKGKRFTTTDGQPLQVDITPENQQLFQERGVPVVRAHLPFDPIRSPQEQTRCLAHDLALIGDALAIFGGSMSLCVQAVAVACDAGAVDMLEHVIALTADTAILVQAACTRRMLSDFVVREVLCKPVVLTIGRKESAERLASEAPKAQLAPVETAQLPPEARCRPKKSNE
jgi:hypothetical protein